MTLRIQEFTWFVLLAVLATGSLVNADEMVATERFGTDTASGMATAVLVMNAALVHTTQLLPADDAGDPADEQVQSVLERLDRLIVEIGSDRSDVVKLNVYVQRSDMRTVVTRHLAEWCEDGGAPAVSFVTTALPAPGAGVAMDAVVAASGTRETTVPKHQHIDILGGSARQSHASVLPRGDVVYVAGQAEPGDLPTATRATLDGLLRTLKHLGLDREHIVSLKCFLQPMSEVAVVNEQMAAFFGDAMIPPVSHVEWISGSSPIEIELVAWAPAAESSESVSYISLPWLKTSPVYSRATRIHGDRRLYISGLYAAEAGDGEQQVRSIFAQLEGVLADAGSDLRHLAKATYYVSDDDPSGQLNKLRPEYYDPERPPAASKAMVHGVAHPDHGITIDMIAAPVK